MTGMGGPQYRWREMHQSWSRYCSCGVASFFSASHLVMALTASAQDWPSNLPELMRVPSQDVNGRRETGDALLVSRPSSLVSTTWTIGSLYLVANSWSRSSCAGTPMIAPVP